MLLFLLKLSILLLTRYSFEKKKKLPFKTGADLGGGCRGCAPPLPRDDLQFSNTTGILQKKNYVVYWCWSRARDECTPPKKNPGSTPDTSKILKFISKYQLLFQWKNFEKYNYDLLYSALKQVKQNS